MRFWKQEADCEVCFVLCSVGIRVVVASRRDLMILSREASGLLQADCLHEISNEGCDLDFCGFGISEDYSGSCVRAAPKVGFPRKPIPTGIQLSSITFLFLDHIKLSNVTS